MLLLQRNDGRMRQSLMDVQLEMQRQCVADIIHHRSRDYWSILACPEEEEEEEK